MSTIDLAMIRAMDARIKSVMNQFTTMGTVSSVDDGQVQVVMDGSSVAVPVICAVSVLPFTDDRVGLVKFGSQWIVAAVTRSAYSPAHLTQIGQVTLGSDTTTISFDNIPQTYSHLRVLGFVRSTANANFDIMFARFNNNSTANSCEWMKGIYNTLTTPGQSLSGSNGFTTAGVMQFGQLPASLQPNNWWGMFVAEIPNYSSSTIVHQIFSQSSFPGFTYGFGGGTNNVQDAVRSIQFGVGGTDKYAQSSTMTLYGVD